MSLLFLDSVGNICLDPEVPNATAEPFLWRGPLAWPGLSTLSLLSDLQLGLHWADRFLSWNVLVAAYKGSGSTCGICMLCPRFMASLAISKLSSGLYFWYNWNLFMWFCFESANSLSFAVALLGDFAGLGCGSCSSHPATYLVDIFISYDYSKTWYCNYCVLLNLDLLWVFP